MKKFSLKWRFRDNELGNVELGEKVIRMLELGYTFGLAPAIRLTKKEGEPDKMELIEVSLIPQKNIVPYTKPIVEIDAEDEIDKW